MARATRTYRKVEPDMWTSGDFRALSAPPPNAQTLWQYLLTGQRTIAIPGVVVARPAVMADDLRWSLRAFDRCLAEIVDAGMAEVDREVGMVVLTKALVSDGRPRDTAHPGSPNGVRTWAAALLKLPACRLRDVVSARLALLMSLIGGAFPSHFAEAMGESCTKTSPSHPASIEETIPHSGIREQEQGTGSERVARAAVPVPAITEPIAPPDAIGRLIDHAVDRMNAARAALDSTSRPIGPFAAQEHRRSLRAHLLTLSVPDRAAALEHAVDVLIAEGQAKREVGHVRLGMLAGPASWQRLQDSTVADVRRAAARDAGRPGRDRPPDPVPATPDQLERAAARRRADEERIQRERDEITRRAEAAALAAQGRAGDDEDDDDDPSEAVAELKQRLAAGAGGTR